MEPSTLLSIEVGGMVLLALAVTTHIVAVEGGWLPPWRVRWAPTVARPRARGPAFGAVPVTILCPSLEMSAGVLLGAVAGEGGLPDLTVLECELLDETEACGMACLETRIHPA